MILVCQGSGQGVGKVILTVTGKVATRSQARTAAGPRIMASLRNLVITILRLAGAASIAAVLRYRARRPSRPLQAITKCGAALPGPRLPCPAVLPPVTGG